MPLINVITVKAIKSATNNDRAKEHGYWLIYAVYWLITLPILLTNQTYFISSNQSPFNTIWHFIVWFLIAYLLLTVALPFILLPFVKQLREKVSETYDAKLYPVTNKQQMMFVFISITVGICEEIIFRGFLYNYLQDYFSLSALVSFILISVVFGLGHFMQGVSGVISSFIFGLIMGYLYFTTGSLLVPIIVHILYDAKAIYITRVLQKST
jgi:membrane protease YdiL (CAAX protease family)